MRRTGLLLVFLSCIAFLIPACDEKIMTGSVDCSECYQEKPDSFRLNVYLTFNDSIDEIPLVLFNGNYEDKDIDYIDTAWAENGNPYWVYVKVDKEYSRCCRIPVFREKYLCCGWYQTESKTCQRGCLLPRLLGYR